MILLTDIPPSLRFYFFILDRFGPKQFVNDRNCLLLPIDLLSKSKPTSKEQQGDFDGAYWTSEIVSQGGTLSSYKACLGLSIVR